MVLSLPGAKVLRSESSCYPFYDASKRVGKTRRQQAALFHWPSADDVDLFIARTDTTYHNQPVRQSDSAQVKAGKILVKRLNDALYAMMHDEK